MKPFGYSLLLDCYDCAPGAADNLELHYRFLESLVRALDMTPMSAPVVMHAPLNAAGAELFPDKAGVAGWVPLIESGIQIHSLEPSHFITIDCYSCKPFDPQVVIDRAKAYFGFKNFEHHFIRRGVNYEK